MPKYSKDFKEMPPHLKGETEKLILEGMDSWKKIREITDKDIHLLMKRRNCSKRNIVFLRGIANLICNIEINQSEASLLMHAGISSINVISKMTPEELIKRTSRLERQLNTGKLASINIEKANSWISAARARQIQN